MDGTNHAKGRTASKLPRRRQHVGRTLTQANRPHRQHAQRFVGRGAPGRSKKRIDSVRHHLAAVDGASALGDALPHKFRTADDPIGRLPLGSFAGEERGEEAIPFRHRFPVGKFLMLVAQPVAFGLFGGDGLFHHGKAPPFPGVLQQFKRGVVEGVDRRRLAKPLRDDFFAKSLARPDNGGRAVGRRRRPRHAFGILAAKIREGRDSRSRHALRRAAHEPAHGGRAKGRRHEIEHPRPAFHGASVGVKMGQPSFLVEKTRHGVVHPGADLGNQTGFYHRGEGAAPATAWVCHPANCRTVCRMRMASVS